MAQPRFLAFNGSIVPYADAKVHVLAPGLTYGAAVFEGIRKCWSEERGKVYVFRLQDHLDRRQYLMRLRRFDQRLTSEQVEAAILDVVRANELREDVHIRPMVWVDGVGRTKVYWAEEAFFCGSGQEIQPTLTLDRLPIGDGASGPITRRLQERYFAAVRGQTNDHAAWLTPVWHGR